jgi:Cu(I)/Ag(I) efflux system membrane fusion protein/cobalt-zinc-cadmium efflux system membrane fusion protein
MTLKDSHLTSLEDARGMRDHPARRAARWVLLGVVIGAAAAGLLGLTPVGDGVRGLLPGRQSDVTQEVGDHEHLWTCPMHPQVIQPEPGQCPICGMDLVPVKSGPTAAPTRDDGSKGGAATAHEPTTPGQRQILFYRSPMDATITSPVPRKDEMGMDYVPVYAEEMTSAAEQGAVVTIDPVVQQNMNVTTEPVARRDVTRQIRTVGYLDYDQERMVSVTTRFSGFVEKTYVNHLGQPVRKGEPLFDVYSPELVQTEQELLSAARYVEQLADAPEATRQRAVALLDAARTRLMYWEISSEQIDRLLSGGEVLRTLTVTAPSDGVVMKRLDGLEGMELRPGMDAIHIADMSDLWLTVEVFEDQLPWVHIGSLATVSLSYYPGDNFTGRVRYIEPSVSEKTRTVQLTLEVPNHGGKLRAGMYATVEFSPVAAANAIAVPSQAVLRTGERNVVVVALGGGRFAPREVRLGSAGDRWVQVLEGLAEGDEIVTSAQFLIDSESNLREAIQHMIEARSSDSAHGHDGS